MLRMMGKRKDNIADKNINCIDLVALLSLSYRVYFDFGYSALALNFYYYSTHNNTSSEGKSSLSLSHFISFFFFSQCGGEF